jgi:hypothetical protein
MPESEKPDPQGGNGNNGGGNGGGGSGADLATVAAGLLAKSSGDANRVIRRLLKENYDYRQDINGLKAKLPGEGAVVLSGDEAKNWEKFKAMGDPKDVAKKLGDGEAAIKDIGDIRLSQGYRDAAEAGGYKPALFERMAKQDGLKVSVKSVEQNGKSVRSAFVVGEDGKETPLKSYVDSEWKDFAAEITAATSAERRGAPPRPDDNPRAPQAGATDEDPQAKEFHAQVGTGRYGF